MKLTKLFLYSSVALMLVACSQEIVEGPQSDLKGLTTFTLKLPTPAGTRSGDGLAATYLNYAVYDASNSSYILGYSGLTEFDSESNTTTVNIELINTKSYEIVFFASSPQALGLTTEGKEDPDTEPVYSFTPYTDDNATPVLSVNYENMTPEGVNGDLYDCFYGVWKGTGGNTTQSLTVPLTRPVAQICWGTNNNLTSGGMKSVFGENLQYMATNFSAQGVPNTLNLLTGVTSTTGNGEVNFNNFTIPSALTFPSISNNTTQYNYIASQFLLAPSTSTYTLDLTLTITNTNVPQGEEGPTPLNIPLNVSSAPLQANYQTVIYGSLLSTNTDLTVTKNADWGTVDSPTNIEAVAIEPATDENGNTYYPVTTAGNFVWMAQEVASGNNFAGENFILQNDINLTQPISPIGSSNPFQGNFDGNNHTIYNLSVTGNGQTGLFGYTNGSNNTPNTISNLTVYGANITSTGNQVGGLIANANNTNIDNITISGKVVINAQGQNSIGGIVGRMWKGSLTNITVDVDPESVIIGNSGVGGVLGATDFALYQIGSEESSITSNIKVNASQNFGGVFGIVNVNSNETLTIYNCSSSGVVTNQGLYNYTYNQYALGGIAGNWGNGSGKTGFTVSFVNCNFTGTLVSQDLTAGYDLAANNAIVGAVGSSVEGITLYISNDSTPSTTNVAQDHYLGSSSITGTSGN